MSPPPLQPASQWASPRSTWTTSAAFLTPPTLPRPCSPPSRAWIEPGAGRSRWLGRGIPVPVSPVTECRCQNRGDALESEPGGVRVETHLVSLDEAAHILRAASQRTTTLPDVLPICPAGGWGTGSRTAIWRWTIFLMGLAGIAKNSPYIHLLVACWLVSSGYAVL
jgi:hypothetical protein